MRQHVWQQAPASGEARVPCTFREATGQLRSAEGYCGQARWSILRAVLTHVDKIQQNCITFYYWKHFYKWTHQYGCLPVKEEPHGWIWYLLSGMIRSHLVIKIQLQLLCKNEHSKCCMCFNKHYKFKDTAQITKKWRHQSSRRRGKVCTVNKRREGKKLSKT